MIRNYLTVAIRSLIRDRFYTAINVLGLAVGLAACLLLTVYIRHETSYDRHHEKGDRIYRVLRQMRGGDGKIRINADTSGPVGPAIEADFPEVEHAVRTLTRPMLLSYGDRHFTTSSCLTDKTFLNVFSRELEEGDPASLEKPQTAFVTRAVSRSLFGEESPIGKTIHLKYKWFEKDYTIVGLLAEEEYLSVPELSYSFLTTDPPTASEGTMYGIYEIWRRQNFFRPLKTYVLLQDGASPDALQAKMNDFVARHMGEDIARTDDYHLQPLEEIYLRAKQDYGYVDIGYGDIKDVYILSAIGVFILLIACVNFVNLETARSTAREREVGMRKVVGATRSHLLTQFMGEALIVAWVASLVGWGIAELVLPAFNGFVIRDLSLDFLTHPSLIAVFAALTLGVGLLTGSYPALLLSRLNPIRMLRGGHTVSGGGGWLRNSLVVFQFAVSMFLIIGTTVVYFQGVYIKSKDRGFDYDLWVALPIFTVNHSLVRQHNAVKASFMRHPGILKAVAGGSPPGSEGRVNRAVMYPTADRTNGVDVATMIVDEDLIDAFGMEIVKGRGFNSAIGQEAASLVLNEAAVRRLGWTGGIDPIGQLLYHEAYNRTQPVIGVIKDFHNASLRDPIGPLVLYMLPAWSDFRFRRIFLKLAPENLEDTVNFIREQWADFVPNDPFEMTFLDEVVERDVAMTNQMMRIFGSGALLAISIACLGLLGLVSYLTQQRTKEIGLRKVMGATQSRILALIYRGPLQLAVVAGLFALPTTYFVMQRWLEDYAYRYELGILPFLVGVGLTGLMALVSVSFEGIRAARRNPADALRGE